VANRGIDTSKSIKAAVQLFSYANERTWHFSATRNLAISMHVGRARDKTYQALMLR